MGILIDIIFVFAAIWTRIFSSTQEV